MGEIWLREWQALTMWRLRRVLAVAALALLAPSVAAASMISDFDLFAGNGVFLGPQNTVQGVLGSNGMISIDNAGTATTIMGGGMIHLKSKESTGGVVSNTDVTIANGRVNGDIDSGGTVYLGNSTTVDGSVRAAGQVFLGNGTRVLGNVHAGAPSGIAVGFNNSASQVVGTVTHRPGTVLSLNGGSVGGDVIGTPDTPTAYMTTPIPPATAFASGGPGFNVPNNTVAPLTLAPGSYGGVFLGANDILKLSAGTYYFNNWTFDNGATLDLTGLGGGSLNLYFTGNVFLGSGFNVLGVGEAEVGQIYAETLGNWTLSNGMANHGKNSWTGTIVASGAGSDIFFGSEATLTGRAWARDLLLTDQYFTQNDPPPAHVPEPATMLLLGSGLLGVGVLARRLRRA